MRPFFWPVHQSTTVLLAHDETQLAFLDDSDEREVVLAAGRLDPLEIVEDELVLTLPYVPRCDRPDCLAVDASVRAGDEPAARSAFDALAALKQGGKPPKK